MLEAAKGCCPSAPPAPTSALTTVPCLGVLCELPPRPRFPAPAPWPLLLLLLLPLLLLAPPPRPPVAVLTLLLSLMLGECSGVCANVGKLLLRADVSLSIDCDLSAVSLLFRAA